MLKISLLFKKFQTLGANNSRISSIKNVKFSRYCCTFRENFDSALVYLLMRVFQNSPDKLHITSGSEKIASPCFHAVSIVSK